MGEMGRRRTMAVFDKRLKKLQQTLQENGVDSCIVEDSTNLYYLTGLVLSAGQLLITQKVAHLLLDGRYIQQGREKSPFPVSLLEAGALVKLLQSKQYDSVENIAFDSALTTYQGYRTLVKVRSEVVKGLKKKRSISLKPLENLFSNLRSIKDSSELKLLRISADLCVKGHQHIVSLLREGITESYLANQLEIFWKQNGGERPSFSPIIAFGKNTALPHYRAGNQVLKKGMPILIDIGVCCNHYQSDMTRVTFFGEPSAEMVQIYRTVKDAMEAAFEKCRAGVSVGTLDDAARKVISLKGYGDLFPHSLGHGVGLDIHEKPAVSGKPAYKSKILQSGMVITIEPGVYSPGIGGVRIEDTIVIENTGFESLIPLSRELTIID